MRSVPQRLLLIWLFAACNGDQLIDTGSSGVRYELRDVDGQPLPAVLESVTNTMGVERVLSVHAAELVLWPDSTAALVARLHRLEAGSDTTFTEGRSDLYYGIRDNIMFICLVPNTPPPFQDCVLGGYSRDTIRITVYWGSSRTGRFARPQ